ncbi:YeeE/YedE family protein [Altererythrobacter sp. ZODW24]|uniref:YeeE/YedE family protein n=1 Tax=Altererythrobacter sp. ZODW24 TaxID=2185142 RepID=UPI000DF84ED1|nr:YeeE/YedE family protein [Altererythrobacter sp. ZODW24]
MRNLIAALVTGIVFGAGLALSDMVNPARVLGFLDLFGDWDPTLAFVMGGALVPSAIAYVITRRMPQPVLHTTFHIPENRVIDRQLLIGGAIFGIGWGLVGYCPGPAIAGLPLAGWQPWLFVAAMLAGMWIHSITDLSILTRRPRALRT